MKPEKLLAVLTILLLVSAAAAVQPGQSHNLSEIHPMDVDLNLSGQDIFNVSELRLKGGLQFEGNAIQNSANMNLLLWDDANTELDFRQNLNLNGNALTGVGSTQCGPSEALLGDGSCGSTASTLSEVLSNGNIAGVHNINMSGSRIMNVTAVEAGDAVNKSYVDQNDDTVNDNQNLGDVLSRGNSTSGTDISVDNANITSAAGNVTFGRSVKVYGEVWAAGTGSGGGGGSSSGLPEILSNNNTAGSNSLNMFGNEISNVGRVVIEHSTNDFLKLRGAGKAPHTLRFDDRDLRIWSGDGVGTVMRFYNETGKVEIPNGDLDMSGNNITDSKGNVTVGKSMRVYGNVWTTGADLAEKYSSPQQLEEGELVAINREKDDSVVRTFRRYQETVAGVVSANPSHVMNAFGDGYPIALEGKVKVRVTESNGEIRRGDRIVPSETPGVGMKCETWNPVEREDTALRKIVAHNERCRSSTLGRALENSEGKYKILVKLS